MFSSNMSYPWRCTIGQFSRSGIPAIRTSFTKVSTSTTPEPSFLCKPLASHITNESWEFLTIWSKILPDGNIIASWRSLSFLRVVRITAETSSKIAFLDKQRRISPPSLTMRVHELKNLSKSAFSAKLLNSVCMSTKATSYVPSAMSSSCHDSPSATWYWYLRMVCPCARARMAASS